MPSITMKHILFFILLLLLIGVGAFFYTRNMRKAPLPDGTPSPTSTPQKSIDFVPGAPKNVTFAFSTGIQPPPKTISTIQVTNGNAPAIVNKFAASLSLPQPQKSTNRMGIQNSYWNTPGYSLSLSVNKNLSTFSYTHITQGKQNTQTNPETAAQAFLQSLQIPGAYTLQIAERTLEKNITGNFDDPQPKLTRISYMIMKDNMPVLLANYDPISLSTSVDERGTVRLATISFPPSSADVLETKPTVPLEECLTRLNDNAGILVSIKDDEQMEPETIPSFTNVTIQKVTMAYVYETGKNTLEPVYLFEGVGYGGIKDEGVRYILPATN